MRFEFVEDKDKYTAKIKVIGVGGAGGNAINNMINAKLKGVEFVTANTDIQDLERSICPTKIQLGASITRGLGAGADPDIGRMSAEESAGEIKETMAGADMVFLASGMGGGTGTGATPVIARECKESGALTVAVVTKPFGFEGDKRMSRALAGIDRLKKEVDTLIIIPNERLKAVGGKSSSFKELITRADEVLLNAVRGISDLIVSSGFINLDFADVKKVMEQMGTAIMGTGRASGENRAAEAAKEAVNSPLLEDISISGAKGLLMNICGSPSMTMEEIDQACTYIKGEVDKDAEIFWGVVFDENMGDEVQITVIATGIDKESCGKVVRLRDLTPDEEHDPWLVRGPNGENLEILDTPTFQRPKITEEPAVMSSRTEQQPHHGKRMNIFRRGLFKESLDYPAFLRVKAD
ncbi:MAG: cell division protein FtsZ [Deltaproteobacteria bacterium HGW-Deltaproteobacteria-15]|jgi:cell division protein FtsZ|nr:MAG: cell division protein FtsZ [Deltaproteobacteria bacterium HGW-Deltaproteobacteria-15]